MSRQQISIVLSSDLIKGTLCAAVPWHIGLIETITVCFYLSGEIAWILYLINHHLRILTPFTPGKIRRYKDKLSLFQIVVIYSV